MSKLQDLFLSRDRTKPEPTTVAGRVLKNVQQQIDGYGGSVVESSAVSAYVSLESFQDAGIEAELRDAGQKLDNAISEIVSLESLSDLRKANKEEPSVSANQQKAAMYAALLGQGANQYVHVKHGTPSLESFQTFIDYSGQGDYLGSRVKAAVESYDERDNRHATAYSIAYNLLTARQDEFGEAFFPTVVVAPDQVGYIVSIRLVNVMDDIRRDVSGSLDKFNKRNIIHAVLDASILDNDSTKIVPVHGTDSASNFVAGLAPVAVDVAGESITTSALAFGKRFSLLGISQTAKLLQTGILDASDAIDSSIKLKSIVVAITDNTDPMDPTTEFIELRTSAIPLAEFHSAQQGHYRTMRLAFDPQQLTVKGNVRLANGTGNSTVLASLATNGHSVHLGISINGSVNQETAETSLTTSDIVVLAVYDEDGQKLSTTSGPGQTTAELFADAVAVGYNLDARRTNSNRRQRGQLLTTDYYQQIYNVPLHAPITTLRPVTVSDQTDAADLAALITATHIRTSNAAVTRLLEAVDTLRDYTQNSQVIEQNPEILGVANWLVGAYFDEITINVTDIVDSLKSHERMLDLQAAIVSMIRHAAYTAYRDSGYKAAADALAGGVAPKPTVVIGTDPVIANYLLVNGDFRTLGNDFDVKIVSTLDTRVTDQIFVTFGQFGEGKDGQPNPMHFGNMGWKPELTLVLPMTRNGQISKELTVQPAFVHVVNLPILVHFKVEGIADVIEKKVIVHNEDQG